MRLDLIERIACTLYLLADVVQAIVQIGLADAAPAHSSMLRSARLS